VVFRRSRRPRHGGSKAGQGAGRYRHRTSRGDKRRAAEKALADKQREEAVNECFVGGWVEVQLGSKKASEFAASAEAEALGQALRLALTDEAVGRAEFGGAFVEAPKLVEVLLGAAADLLLVGLFQTAASNGQLAAELVEERADEPLTLGWCKCDD
jgi:hypothetical protein